MARMAGENFDKESFEKYLDAYDLKGRGAGSDKKPPVSRFSAKDVRYVFDRGIDRGGSKSDVARLVLDYADDMMGKTKMGGGTERALNKLRGYLKDEDVMQGEPDQPVSVDPIPEEPRDPTLPGPVDFATRVEEATYPPFAGSYSQFIGGDPSNPANYYQGDPTFDPNRAFIAAMRPADFVNPVPGDLSSFIRSLQTGSYLSDVVGDLAGGDDMSERTYETESDRVARRVSDGMNFLTGAFAVM